jgi:hypothetical protein
LLVRSDQVGTATGGICLETDAPVKPDTETDPAEVPDEGKEEELGERVRRIIREIPDPTPQPGGQ